MSEKKRFAIVGAAVAAALSIHKAKKEGFTLVEPSITTFKKKRGDKDELSHYRLSGWLNENYTITVPIYQISEENPNEEMRGKWVVAPMVKDAYNRNRATCYLWLGRDMAKSKEHPGSGVFTQIPLGSMEDIINDIVEKLNDPELYKDAIENDMVTKTKPRVDRVTGETEVNDILQIPMDQFYGVEEARFSCRSSIVDGKVVFRASGFDFAFGDHAIAYRTQPGSQFKQDFRGGHIPQMQGSENQPRELVAMVQDGLDKAYAEVLKNEKIESLEVPKARATTQQSRMGYKAQLEEMFSKGHKKTETTEGVADRTAAPSNNEASFEDILDETIKG